MLRKNEENEEKRPCPDCAQSSSSSNCGSHRVYLYIVAKKSVAPPPTGVGGRWVALANPALCESSPLRIRIGLEKGERMSQNYVSGSRDSCACWVICKCRFNTSHKERRSRKWHFQTDAHAKREICLQIWYDLTCKFPNIWTNQYTFEQIPIYKSQMLSLRLQILSLRLQIISFVWIMVHVYTNNIETNLSP